MLWADWSVVENFHRSYPFTALWLGLSSKLGCFRDIVSGPAHLDGVSRLWGNSLHGEDNLKLHLWRDVSRRKLVQRWLLIWKCLVVKWLVIFIPSNFWVYFRESYFAFLMWSDIGVYFTLDFTLDFAHSGSLIAELGWWIFSKIACVLIKAFAFVWPAARPNGAVLASEVMNTNKLLVIVWRIWNFDTNEYSWRKIFEYPNIRHTKHSSYLTFLFRQHNLGPGNFILTKCESKSVEFKVWKWKNVVWGLKVYEHYEQCEQNDQYE